MKDDAQFPTLPPEDLETLARFGTEVFLNPGDYAFQEGHAADSFYVVRDGEIKITRKVGREEMILARHLPGEFSGELSLLTEGATNIASGQAQTPSHVIRIPNDALREMLNQNLPVAGKIVSAMARRVRTAEAMVQQREKMASLGKLSAGLAHELNNPATAANRASRQLDTVLQTLTDVTLSERWSQLLPEQRIWLQEQTTKRRAGLLTKKPLDAIACSDWEDRVTEWLEDRSIPEAWKLAPDLVDAALDIDTLDEIAALFPIASLTDILSWLTASSAADRLRREIEQSTGRISELVKAVKVYSYMDQASLQDVDVVETLESTLTILAHKTKGEITIVRHYAPDLPKVSAYGSELNQVWTNLLDNAIDALAGHGTITLTTWRDTTCVMVEIADDGPGIPPEIQSRIFEPFFTTKGVGEGTGLGLDTAYRIVVRRHSGDLCFESEPGSTRFLVSLPITQ